MVAAAESEGVGGSSSNLGGDFGGIFTAAPMPSRADAWVRLYAALAPRFGNEGPSRSAKRPIRC